MQKASCPHSCPVEMVTWPDAIQFANALSKKEGLDTCYVVKDKDVKWTTGLSCKGWRLPTEAEWEWAARGGEDFVFAGSNKAKEVAWVQSGMPRQICSKKKNGYDLCDMSGNIGEWV